MAELEPSLNISLLTSRYIYLSLMLEIQIMILKYSTKALTL